MEPQEQSFRSDSKAEMMGSGIYANVFSMMQPYKIRMVLSIFFGTVSSFLSIAPFLLVYFIIDNYMAATLTPNILLSYGLWLLGFSFLRAWTFNVSTQLSHLIAAEIMGDIRTKVGQKLKIVPMGFFSTTDSQSVQKMVTEDVEAMEDGIAHLIPEITAAIIPPLTVMATMFYMDWRLALGGVFGIVAGFFSMGMAMGRVGSDKLNKYMEGKARMGRQTTELIACLPIVKLFNSGGHALAKTEKGFTDYAALVKNWITATLSPMQWFFLLSTSNLVFVLPVTILVYNYANVEMSVLAFFLIMASYMNVVTMKFHGITHRFETQKNIHYRMNQFLSSAEIQYHTIETVPKSYDVILKNVHFAYDEKPVLKGVDLSIPAGSSLALVGESGAGKSTIAKLLPRFWDVQQGAITIGGIDIRQMAERDLSACLSFVFQETFLFSQTVAENLLLAKADATLDELQYVCQQAQIHDFIATLPDGYETTIHGNTNLSGGQKQRLCIARAILKNAPILVLDEATSFADPENESLVQKAISNLIKGKTLIVIAHRLSTIVNLDKIAVIQNGQVAECDNHKALLASNGAYAAMWKVYQRSQGFVLGKAT